MDCFTIRTAVLRPGERAWIADRLTRPGSDFQKKLLDGTASGQIAMALDKGEIVGWARTERWEKWDTLEAFVSPKFRGRGLATWCVMGLVAANAFDKDNAGFVAVFRPSMTPIASKVGLFPVRFYRSEDGEWTLCH